MKVCISGGIWCPLPEPADALGRFGVADSRFPLDHLAQSPAKMSRRAGQQSVPCPVSVLRRRAVGQSLAIDDSTTAPGFCRPCRGSMLLGGRNPALTRWAIVWRPSGPGATAFGLDHRGD